MAKTETTTAQTETRYRVVINSDSGPGGTNRVELIHNGRIVSVERDKEVLLTKPYLGVLEKAAIRGYTAADQGGVKAVPGRRRFSYSLLGQEEVATSATDSAESSDTTGTTTSTTDAGDATS